MSGRTVAEVLGWELLDDLQPTDIWDNPAVHDGCCTARWQAPDGEVYDGSCAGPEPTVDDMLAWLKQQQAFVCLVTTGLTATVEYVHSEGFYGFKRADTLHEALEAAVLAVAEREEPGDE